MPLIDLKKMPKTKLKIIMIQAVVIFCILGLPLTVFGSYYIMKEFVWSGNKKKDTVETKKNKPKEIKSVFNISVELEDKYAMTLISSFGSKEQANRQIYFTVANNSNNVDIQINELKKNAGKIVEKQVNNGFQTTEYVQIDDVKNAIVIEENLTGQKIARISKPQDPNSFFYFDLNSKKIGEKNLNIKTPQADTFFYNTKLNFHPELVKNDQDRIVLVSIKGKTTQLDQSSALDEIIKKIIITD